MTGAVLLSAAAEQLASGEANLTVMVVAAIGLVGTVFGAVVAAIVQRLNHRDQSKVDVFGDATDRLSQAWSRIDTLEDRRRTDDSRIDQLEDDLRRARAEASKALTEAMMLRRALRDLVRFLADHFPDQSPPVDIEALYGVVLDDD